MGSRSRLSSPRMASRCGVALTCRRALSTGGWRLRTAQHIALSGLRVGNLDLQADGRTAAQLAAAAAAATCATPVPDAHSFPGGDALGRDRRS